MSAAATHPIPPAVLVTGTGTGIGKTALTVALVQAVRQAGWPAIALKPYESGCEGAPADALALATASGQPTLARHPRFYRARAPVAPWAATRMGETPPPSVDVMAGTLMQMAAQCAGGAAMMDAPLVWAESAGGLFVPLDAGSTFADLAAKLAWPLLLVAPNRLGVLSHTIATAEAARARGLHVHAIVLNDVEDDAAVDDPSRRHNADILRTHLAPLPVHTFAHHVDDPSRLAAAATLLRALWLR